MILDIYTKYLRTDELDNFYQRLIYLLDLYDENNDNNISKEEMISLLESLSCDFESVKSGFLKAYLISNLKSGLNENFKKNFRSQLFNLNIHNSTRGNEIYVDIKDNPEETTSDSKHK